MQVLKYYLYFSHRFGSLILNFNKIRSLLKISIIMNTLRMFKQWLKIFSKKDLRFKLWIAHNLKCRLHAWGCFDNFFLISNLK